MVNVSLWDVAARINAQRVLLWICVACVVVLYLALVSNRVSMVEPFSPVSTTNSVPGAPVETSATEVSLVAHEAPAKDPFTSEFLAELLERSERMRLEEERARQEAAEPPPKIVEEPPPVQGPPRPAAELLYRGMFTRPDGTVLGLIENQRSNQTSFHQAGDEVEGLTIGTITRGSLELVLDHEVKVTLAVGIATSFQPDK